ncbi:glycoside hydrolase family 43 protein [Dysgonomonas sp. 520]|uniref:glycoside hydrolase family 43 protein n=1 Tax=Dysgonomonas sp. 520 TaxID=2302931 RepID=UPI0013CFABF8|nr:glycoside hydrolase family 43 protein [Dysgonomonas sp. 520]NDW08691.1 beta-xylosidase [Dysgonomonas sp. 520]
MSKIPIELADPTIFYKDGTYYLYGTSHEDGILVYTSTDLTEWEGPKGATNGLALSKENSFGSKWFWAPQVFERDGKFYLVYTADEHIAIAQSDSPLGPFRQETPTKISGKNRQIDPYLFFDDNGKIYLYYVKLDNGNKLYVSEMKNDLSDIKPETTRFCIEAAPNTWEDTENADWKVAEGPTIIKHNELYYFFYSANDFRNKDYAVGYATAKSPYGPWKKYEGNPIISKENIGINGVGHGDFFKDANNNWKYVFHTHQSDTIVDKRKTAIVSAAFEKDSSGVDKMKIDYKSFIFLEQ